MEAIENQRRLGAPHCYGAGWIVMGRRTRVPTSGFIGVAVLIFGFVILSIIFHSE
jgi:hypothetical protein